MRVIVIGGSGHIGTYLVPQLVAAGHEVTEVSRGEREPYQPNKAWEHVRKVKIDRAEAEKSGEWGTKLRELQPDIVVDLICFTPESAQILVGALKGQVQHLLHCGTIWIHGPSVTVPTTEAAPRRPFGEYGIRKAAIETYLLGEARRDGFPVTLLHPGHIVGPGWAPLNPAGHFNPEVFSRIARGEELTLPNLGMETVHHVHAADVAQAFMQSINNWSTSVGESFHVVSPAAISLRGYAEAMYAWFGQEPKLKFSGWEEWRQTVPENEAGATWDHIAHSPNCSIEKARRLIAYNPRYSSLEAVYESVSWLIDNGVVSTSQK